MLTAEYIYIYTNTLNYIHPCLQMLTCMCMIKTTPIATHTYTMFNFLLVSFPYASWKKTREEIQNGDTYI